MCFSCSAATSLMELWNTPGVAEKVEETARVYFANSILTINLIPALLVGALLLFCEYFSFSHCSCFTFRNSHIHLEITSHFPQCFPHCWVSPS